MASDGDWWDWAATAAAEGRMRPAVRPLWWLWRVWNFTRPSSLLTRAWLVFGGIIVGFADVGGGTFWTSSSGKWALALCVLCVCKGLGRREVDVKPLPRRRHRHGRR